MCTDSDAGENSRLSFRLMTLSAPFHLDTNTGELRTNQILDREREAVHRLVALVMDHGRPARSASVSVLVTVMDINDHDPVIVFPAKGNGTVTISVREAIGELCLSKN
ncbi:unnamed protein product [Protopolystoma xenopodis]|uniref:Cadherin domain-containing protein n=1 Tax=Protopolystoma xenopodis TaxID=117903 RepID=A0A448WKW6_9PLAT|nr:unnamed protein product [Protopolystoma xenopodis]